MRRLKHNGNIKRKSARREAEQKQREDEERIAEEHLPCILGQPVKI